MKRLVCVVEGKGDVRAAPRLCARVLHSLLGVADWHVDEEPIRHPRSKLVDETVRPPHRTANAHGIARVMQIAKARPNSRAILLIVDGDDDCAAVWGPSAASVARAEWPIADAVMAVREYESWLLVGLFNGVYSKNCG